MNALVTGATGFSGARLVRALQRKGVNVSIICRPTSDTAQLLDTPVRIFRGDLASPDDMRDAMSGCDVVYHLAAFAKNWSRYPEEVHRITSYNVCYTKLLRSPGCRGAARCRMSAGR